MIFKENSREQIIKAIKDADPASVTPYDLNNEKLVIFDLTESNEELKSFDIADTEKFNQYIFGKLKENNARVGIGRYNEDRYIYKRSRVFTGIGEPRTVHLGIDIWAEAGTDVFAPFNSVVHSFGNNSSFGDYGPTIILRHKIESFIFHTLYGHLSLSSIKDLTDSLNYDLFTLTLGSTIGLPE